MDKRRLGIAVLCSLVTMAALYPYLLVFSITDNPFASSEEDSLGWALSKNSLMALAMLLPSIAAQKRWVLRQSIEGWRLVLLFLYMTPISIVATLVLFWGLMGGLVWIGGMAVISPIFVLTAVILVQACTAERPRN